MKAVFALVFCFLAAAVSAGIISPVYLTHSGNGVFYPIELRKVIQYGSKPLFTAELFKPSFFGAFPQYDKLQYVPVVEAPAPGTAPVLFIPAPVPAPTSTLVAKADAASPAGVAGSSIVARSDEAVPYSVVANAGPAAAYSSAVVHPGKASGPFTAGAQASVVGGSH